MKKIQIISGQLSNEIFKKRSVWVLIGLFNFLIIYAGITGILQFNKLEEVRSKYQKEVRDSWVNSPDKHPHRMAHYGFIALRPKSNLSFFDFGIESFTGNVIFLEAHKQNSTNFSEASVSTSMLRFGEISIAMILQVLLPLFIFFIGFNAISVDRENGTLKVLIAQGITWKELLIGRILGLFQIVLYIFLPAIIITFLLGAFYCNSEVDWCNLIGLFFIYTISIFIYCSISIFVSAFSSSSKLALVILIGLWLTFIVVIPRFAQMIASNVYETPSKIAFESAIEEDIFKHGDSHNPNDEHYKSLKDSILRANNVDSVEQLNFNYNGFQMKEGERISSEIYSKHLQDLNLIYKKQNSFVEYAAFLNPYLCIKYLSMSLCNTDFETYIDFQQQAEKYRYDLAQEMNNLQIKLIPNKASPDSPKQNGIDKKYWSAFKDFKYSKPQLISVLHNIKFVIVSLFFWVVLVMILIQIFSKKLKVI
jgi:ABC-2 type transport system permease protein